MSEHGRNHWEFVERHDQYLAQIAKIEARAEAEKSVLARKLMDLPPSKFKLPKRREPKPKPRVDGQLFTLEEMAAKLNTSTKTVVDHVKSGALRCIIIGKGKKRPTYRFTPADLDRFIEQQRQKRQRHVCLQRPPLVVLHLRVLARRSSTSRLDSEAQQTRSASGRARGQGARAC